MSNEIEYLRPEHLRESSPYEKKLDRIIELLKDIKYFESEIYGILQSRLP